MSNLIDYNDISHQLNGQWPEVLSMYGITLPEFKGRNTKNGPCPLCGGDDRAHWRMTDDRPSLYCRACTNGTMASVEQVIMSYANIDFGELSGQLMTYLGVKNNPDAARAIAAAPKKIHVPRSELSKENQELSAERLSKLEYVDQLPFLLARNAAPSGQITHKKGAPVVPLVNVAGDVVNLARYDDSGVSYLAGGPTYGAFYIIPGGADKVICVDLIDALRLRLKLGATVLCGFDARQVLWSVQHLREHLDGAQFAVREHDQIDEELLDFGCSLLYLSGDDYGFKVNNDNY